MKTELLNWITLAVAVAGLVLGVVNLILVVRIGKQMLSDLKQWQLGVERQLGRVEGAVASSVTAQSAG